MNIKTIENYPDFSEPVIGSVLGMEMMNQVKKHGLELTRANVNAVQGSSSNKWVTCAAGDIRSNSPRQVSDAVGDGAAAGMAAQRYLQKLA